MPRLTNEDYLKRHNLLALLWEQDQHVYAWLSYKEQRDLHDYYIPTKSLTDLELLTHRKQVTKKNPSLPQQASRAFAVMPRQARTPIPVTTPSHKSKQVTIRALARPEIDVEKLATALLQMAEEMTPEEWAKFETENEKLLSKRRKAA